MNHHPRQPVPEHVLAETLKYQAFLARSQWWSEAEIRRYQFDHLMKIFHHARQHVAFYRERFVALAKPPDTLEQWSTLPVLTRRDVQLAGERLFSSTLPTGHAPAQPMTSSGSTGAPITVRSTPVTTFIWHGLTLREHAWQQRDLGGTLAAIRPDSSGKALPPRGLRLSSWGPPAGMLGTGPSALLALHSRVAEQMTWLEHINPHYLLTYPSNALELLRLFPHARRKLTRLRELRTLSERVSPELRNQLREAWGVGLVDMYTAREVGYIALQCPVHDHYHVQSESVYVEVVRDDGAPCQPGEVGRVLVTALHNYASPLIRYELGDYAEVGAACDCGRKLPVIGRIVGRVRNMAVLPNGERRWPYVHMVHDVLRDHYGDRLPVKQLQLVQRALDSIEIRIAADAPLPELVETRMRAVVQDILAPTFAVSFVYCREIARGKGGKYEEFMTEIA